MASSKQRELTVLKRAVCKKASTSYGVQAGDLIFLVKNDKEDVYTTILRNTGRHTCTCAGNASFGKKCWHIKECEYSENIRRESAKLAPSFAAKSMPVWAMWLLESGVLVAPSKQVVEMPAPKVVDLPEELKGHRKTMRVKGDPIVKDTSVLNGAQQSAGVLMALPSRKAKAS